MQDRIRASLATVPAKLTGRKTYLAAAAGALLGAAAVLWLPEPTATWDDPTAGATAAVVGEVQRLVGALALYVTALVVFLRLGVAKGPTGRDSEGRCRACGYRRRATSGRAVVGGRTTRPPSPLVEEDSP